MKYKNLLNCLYNRNIKGGQSELECKFAEYGDTFNIELVNIWDKKIDCNIGHFGYNFYFRTVYGIKSKQYKNIKTLYTAIKNKAKKHNLTLQSIGLLKNYRYKPLITS